MQIHEFADWCERMNLELSCYRFSSNQIYGSNKNWHLMVKKTESGVTLEVEVIENSLTVCVERVMAQFTTAANHGMPALMKPTIEETAVPDPSPEIPF